MRRNFFYLITIAMAVILTASIPVTLTGQMTLSFQHTGRVTIGLCGSGNATIDWGDGTRVETHTLKFSMVPYYHTYSGATPRTITITGSDIRGLVCTDMQLTSLDVSKNPALSILDCSRNKLTSIDLSNNLDLRHLTCTNNQLTNLDVSKIIWLGLIRCSYNQLTSLDLNNNRAIKNLYCDNNPFTTVNMENLFRSLHNNVINGGKAIFPGSTSANTGIARETGWTIGGLTN